jgi:hypothetical protein
MSITPRKHLLNSIDFYLRWKGEKRDRKRDAILRHVDVYVATELEKYKSEVLATIEGCKVDIEATRARMLELGENPKLLDNRELDWIDELQALQTKKDK